MDTEYLDLVDENDMVIGRLPREEFYEKKLKNFRTVHFFLKNSKGKLWIPRRSIQKKMWPGSLDCSMGGHVMSGESYFDALIRETKEELNINLSEQEFKLLGYINPFLPDFPDFPCFTQCYEMIGDIEPQYNKIDFSEGNWLFPMELISILQKSIEPPTKDVLEKLVKYFYL